MLALTSLLVNALALAATQAAPNLEVKGCDVGQVYAFNTAACQITLSNSGDRPVHVSDVKPAKPGDSVTPTSLTIAPHAEAYLAAKIHTGNDLAGARHAFHFKTDQTARPERGADVTAFVLSALDQTRPDIDFGVVVAGKGSPDKRLPLGSHETASFRITKVIDKPADIDVTITPDGQALSAHMGADAALGLHAGYIKIAIDTPNQKEAWVAFKADVHGDIVPSSNPWDLGLMRLGNRNEFKLRLASASKTAFEPGALTLENINGSAKLLPCAGEGKSCRIVALTISDKQGTGAINGKVWLDLPQTHQRLPILVWGLLLARETKVKVVDPLTGEIEGEPKTGGSSKAATAKPSVDIARSLEAATTAVAEQTPPGSGPLLKWSVANESAVYGYQIFRANAEAGPFVLQNTTVITARHADAGSNYQWRDGSAQPGKAYWYYIGLVNNDGSKQQLSGTQKIVAK